MSNREYSIAILFQRRDIRFFLILFLTALVPAFSIAQPLQTADPFSRTRYGIATGLNWNLHSADFQQLPGIPNCCPIFESGSGTGVSVGLLYEIPLSRVLLLGFRGSFAVQSATLKAMEEKKLGGDMLYSGKIEHDIQSSLSTVGIEPLLGIRAVGRFHLYAGGRFGIVTGQSFEQFEQLIEPQSGYFADTRQRTRNQVNGAIPDITSFQVALLIGASHEAPLNKSRTLLLAPEMFFQLALTPVVKSLAWKANALRFGLALKYAPEQIQQTEELTVSAQPLPKQEIVVKEMAVNTPAEQVPLLTANYTTSALDEIGHEHPLTVIRYEEFTSSQTLPLLNYVFFDENSDQLTRYNFLKEEEAATFTVEQLHTPEVLPVYYHVLNIVGRRMLNNPTATITLAGCNSDQGLEKENKELSRRRAETVRAYLHTIWGIDESRMKIEVHNLPIKASKTMDEDVQSAIAENRRVEILSDSWKILEPVVIRDTLRTVTPPLVRFHPDVQAEAGIRTWALSIRSPQMELMKFAGRDSIPGIVEWNPLPSAMNTGLPDRLKYELVVEDTKGRHEAAPAQTVPVERITLEKKRSERIADREIDRYGLILFDFDRAELSDANKRIMETIRSKIRDGAHVTITGFTDRLGDAEYNHRLSGERARAAAKLLGMGVPEVSGAGEKELYNNALPEGRFYNRTVLIVVETPVR